MSDPFISAALLEGIPSTYAGARDGIDSILRDRGLRRSTPEDTARSLLLGAAATASLEGSAYDADTLASGGGDAVATAPSSSERAVSSGVLRRRPRSRRIESMPSRVPAYVDGMPSRRAAEMKGSDTTEAYRPPVGRTSSLGT